MKTEPKALSVFEKFAARRIAEFPTLFSHKDDVISECILNSSGECFWKNGSLSQPNQNYDSKTKKWTRYPLQMPEITAAKLHGYDLPKIGWDIGNERAPISNLPNNADKSFLEAIGLFLFRWEKLGNAEWGTLASAHCLLVWQTPVNPHANEPQRKLADYLKFMELIPKWRAMIREVEHFQRYGEIDVRTFQAVDI